MTETTLLKTGRPDRNRITRVVDSAGRVLGVRPPGVLQKLRVFEVVGAENARNEQYIGFAGLAASLVEVDGEPCEPIASKRQLEARVLLLDEHGLEAVGRALAGEPGGEIASTADLASSEQIPD